MIGTEPSALFTLQGLNSFNKKHRLLLRTAQQLPSPPKAITPPLRPSKEHSEMVITTKRGKSDVIIVSLYLS